MQVRRVDSTGKVAVGDGPAEASRHGVVAEKAGAIARADHSRRSGVEPRPEVDRRALDVGAREQRAAKRDDREKLRAPGGIAEGASGLTAPRPALDERPPLEQAEAIAKQPVFRPRTVRA